MRWSGTYIHRCLAGIRRHKSVAALIVVFAGVGLFLAATINPYGIATQAHLYTPADSSGSHILRAKVLDCETDRSCRAVLLDGTPGETVTLTLPAQIPTARKNQIVLVTLNPLLSEAPYSFSDSWRLPGVMVLLVIFVVLIFLVTGLRGIMSVLGLGFSLLVLTFYVLPRILDGVNATLVIVCGAYVIALVSIFVAHGMNHRAYIMVLAVVASLTIVIILTLLVSYAIPFSGIADEADAYLQFDHQQLRLSDIYFGGIIITTLGVLDDVVATQVAAVDELFAANRSLHVGELFRRASSVGKEHIASLVNTLALVYVGAALPLLVRYASYSSAVPLPVVLNGEVVAEEIVRLLTSSIGIVLAVPCSTLIAAVLVHRHGDQRRVQSSTR